MAMLKLALLVCFCSTVMAEADNEDDSGPVYWGYVQADEDFHHYPVALPKEFAICEEEDKHTWESGWEYCAKNRQSPININTELCVNSDLELGAFTFTNYDVDLPTMNAHNNGHGIAMTPNDASLLTQQMSAGGLEKTYNFIQFHAHWGREDTEGSEHTVDGVAAPLELHLVHYDSDFADLGASLAAPTEKGNALAVLGIMYEIDDSADDIDWITKMLAAGTAEGDNVAKYQGKEHNVDFGTLKLADVLPENTAEFFRYEGSLTTPTCNEEVQWTVFKNKVKINSAQMAALRSTYEFTSGATMSVNYRPPQALNGRLVKASFGSSEANAENCASADAVAIAAARTNEIARGRECVVTGAAVSHQVSALLVSLVALLAVFYH